ncbi:uncharacterized protein LOC130989283 isoform X2 [Salvia miltiorrhiza]|uniref:uncharacterized protein LOC130989283 isoform X2 n=1 Tax=Salvia miltiorrhiza TaxID=226208 RepID=UPI0025AC1D29|nr:uncharacterized protein LOC130989283 isoform X2 [Salvia miltiorrhiza]
MSSRLMKKVLHEQSAPLQELDSDDDSDSPESSAPARNLFSLLEDDDDDIGTNSHEAHDDQEKGKDADETSDCDIAGDHPSSERTAFNTVLTRNVKSKKKKKKKKNSNREYSSLVNDSGSSDLKLDNLSLIASSSGHQETSSPAKKKLLNGDGDAKLPRKLSKTSVLEVDPKFLSAENELRRIFGSRVVKSQERNPSPANPRLMRGVRRGNHNLKKTIIISPSQHWPRWDGSLSMELLKTLEGVHYFRYTHSPSYAQAQRAFESAKENHDLNGIASILLNHPYHIDSLTALADYFKFTGEHQMSADATAKSLYAMECAWHPLFTPSKNCQLKYVHDTNKPLFSALFTHMKNMDRRGCHRSALEICKLLLSLDPNDPVGAMFCIDYYALRAEEHDWLEQFAEEYKSDNSLWLFPNFSYSLAICRFYLERKEVLDGGETDVGKATSFELMKQALMLHPSVLKKLVVKVPLNDRKWTSVVKHSFFRSEETGSPSLDHLIAIYIEKSYIIWRLPDLQKLLYDSAISLIEMLEKKESDVNDWACVRKEAFSLEKNEYSHLLVSEFSDSVPTMPPENLQDFIVDQRGGIELPQQIPENHALRDVANRSPLAVLFESILPWIHYGPGDGEDEHHLPEPADED